MLVKEIENIINTLYPERYQEKYDNSGTQIRFPDQTVTGILFSLDVDSNVIDEAFQKGCNLIISHHPVIFKPLKQIDSSEARSRAIISGITRKISLYAVHTNLDKFYYYKLSDHLGFEHEKILSVTDLSDDKQEIGFGSIAEIPANTDLQQLMVHVKRKLEIDFVLYSGDLKKNITTVAVLNGAGGRQIEHIIKTCKIDCILTGDVTYHDMKYALESSVPVIDIGHYGSEKVLMLFLMHELQDCLTKLEESKDIPLYISEIEQNPYKMF